MPDGPRADDARFAYTLDVVGLGYVPIVGDSFKIITHDLRLAGSQFSAMTVSGFSSVVTFDVSKSSPKPRRTARQRRN